MVLLQLGETMYQGTDPPGEVRASVNHAANSRPYRPLDSGMRVECIKDRL